MKKGTKIRIAKFGTLAVALTLASSLGISSLTAFAANDQAREGKVSTTYGSFDDVLKAEQSLNLKLAEEGFALLKNKGGALPLDASAKVTLLGGNAYSIQDGGGGSGAASRPGNTSLHIGDFVPRTVSTFADGVKKGLSINKTVEDLYMASGVAQANGENKTYMTPLTEGNGVVEFDGEKYNTAAEGYLKDVESSYTEFGDAAIINIMRSGSEFNDNLSSGVQNHADDTEHYLTLNDYERQLLAYAKYQKEQKKFSKIIVFINAASPMEIGMLEDDDAFDAILWIGTTGWNGSEVIADVLTGKINPSGHVVDFWMRDFKTDPTYYNYGSAGNANIIYEDAAEIQTEGLALTYSEGIFMGYRYYETVAADLGDKGEAWYKKNTLYPFGHGLSYTTFEQEMTVNGTLGKDSELTVTVKVTNTGSKAGKDVVQLYSTPDYTAGEVDKAAVNLVSFAKTDIIRPGANATVTMKIASKDLASFDFNDANKNSHYGYEIDAGNIVLSVRTDSHNLANADESKATATLTAAADILWDEDNDPNTPNNIFSQTEGKWEMYNTDVSHWLKSGKDHDLHRNALLNDAKDGAADVSKLHWLKGEGNDNVFTAEAGLVLSYREDATAAKDFDDQTTEAVETNYANVWTKTAADMQGRKQGTGVPDQKTGLYPITLKDMAGKSYDDAKWDELLDQLTWDELKNFVGNTAGSYANAPIDSIGKPRVTDQDGPGQLKANGINGWFWVGETVIAATWNTELAHEQGTLVGNESIWNSGGGWYGPAMNNHRNPLAGRNFEYYSQDGVQGGLIAAAVVGGCVEAGGRVYIKHAFLNDQEAGRMNGLATFCNEQAIREIYAKPFELAIRLGHANGIMSAFPNIALQSSASYAMNIQLFTNEWGYRGATVTDMYMGAAKTGWSADAMVRGCIFPLGNSVRDISGTWNAEKSYVELDGQPSYTQWYWVRETAKRLLFTYVNSAAYMEGFMPKLATAGAATSYTGNVGEDVGELKTFDTEYLDKYFGEGQYTITGDLPAGLTIDPETGIITGTALVPTFALQQGSSGRPATVNLYRDYTVTVAGTAEGKEWITTSVTIRFSILDPRADYLQDQVDKLNATIEELQETIEALQATVTELQTAIEGKADAETVTALEAKVTELQTKATELETKVTELTGKLSAAESKITELEAAIKALQEKVEALEKKGGCGGVIGMGAAAVAAITILGGAFFVTRRKENK